MKKSLEAVRGDYLVDIRTGNLFEVLESSPFQLQTENNVRTYKDSEIRRWFKVARMSNITSNIAPQPVTHAALTMDAMTRVITQQGCTMKQNKDHIAVKYNGKNVLEIRPTKKYYNIVVRQSIFTQENLALMESRYYGKLVGGGTWTLNYRVRVTELSMFELLLQLAIAHTSR